MRFRDYKYTDANMIDRIPFRLAYTKDITMVIPYCDECCDTVKDENNNTLKNNTRFFGNIASALMVNPSKLIYPVWLDEYDNVMSFEETFRKAGELFTRKKLRLHVEFVIVKRDYIELPEDEIINAFGGTERASVFVRDVESLKGADTEAMNIFSAYFEAESHDSFFSIERNKTHLSDMFAGRGLYDSFAHFKFDSRAMEFRDVSGCELFTFMSKRPCLTRADMFTVRAGNSPEFFRDYQILWDWYINNRRAWKTLCEGLGDISDKRDIIGEFRVKKEHEKAPNTEIRKYILPSVCRGSVEKITNKLTKNHVTESIVIRSYTTNSFELVISDRCNYGSSYDSLFGNPYRLMSSDAIEASDRGGQIVNVRFDNLIAEDIGVPGFNDENRKGVLALIEHFNSIGFITNLKLDDVRGVMSFTYGSREIKKLLTSAGRMLEVWTYHKARELGYFDDVVAGLEIQRGEERPLKNEFDCIMIKGFRTLFVECKARNVLDQDMYNKLAGLAHEFGINCTPVMVADTNEPAAGEIAATNEEMRLRGFVTNPKVITIWRRSDIENIGEILMNIMNGV